MLHSIYRQDFSVFSYKETSMKSRLLALMFALALGGCAPDPYGPDVSGSVAFGTNGVYAGSIGVSSGGYYRPGYYGTPLVFPVLPPPVIVRPRPHPPVHGVLPPPPPHRPPAHGIRPPGPPGRPPVHGIRPPGHPGRPPMMRPGGPRPPAMAPGRPGGPRPPVMAPGRHGGPRPPMARPVGGKAPRPPMMRPGSSSSRPPAFRPGGMMRPGGPRR